MQTHSIALILGLMTFAATAQIRVETVATGFNASGDVSVAPNGDIFVGDYGVTLSSANGRQTLRIKPDGTVSVHATGFASATGNVIGPDGVLYQATSGQQRVVRVARDGSTSTFASGLAGGIIGIGFDSQGNLYANSCNNQLVYKVVPGNAPTVLSSGAPFNCPNGMAIDDDDNIYSVNFNDRNIIKTTPDGQSSVFAQTPIGPFRPGGGNGHITFGNGRLYAAVNATSQIVEVTLDGQVTVIAGDGTRGHADGDPLSASFSFPNGIDLSPDGRRLYLNEAEGTSETSLSGAIRLNPARLRVIVLEDAAVPFAIEFGVSGAWLDPATAGQGFLFEVLPSSNQLFGAWFTYEAASAKVGASEHRWLTLQGDIDGDRADLTISNSSGGVFDDPATVTTESVGAATLTFFDCETAMLDYTFDDGLTGTIDLVRLSSPQCAANR